MAVSEATVASGPQASRLPCVDDARRWLGCVGPSCTTERCPWKRSASVAAIVTTTTIHNGAKCATCAHAVDVAGASGRSVDHAQIKQRARELHQQGQNYEQIARALGINSGVAWNYVNKDRPTRPTSNRNPVRCTAGHWRGLVTVAALVGRLVPLEAGIGRDCPDYEPAPVLRPEVLERRRQDAARAAKRRQAAKDAAA